MKKSMIPAFAGMPIALLFLFSPIAARADDGEVLRKVNEIIDNQKLIMETLEQLKSELQIIKVRSTR